MKDIQNISRHIGESPETQILNYIPITQDLATSGQPTPLQIKAIAEAGYDSIINLAMHDSPNALFDEGGLVSEAGMNYFHIPVPFDAPTIEHSKRFINLMGALNEDYQRVWVHCAYNWRVSAFMTHYRMTKPEEMLVLEQWKPDDTWLAFLELQPRGFELRERKF